MGEERVCYARESKSQRGQFTYGFWLIRGLNLFAFKFLPINIPEKRMLLDVTFTFGSATQTFARVFGHQLWEKRKAGFNETRVGRGMWAAQKQWLPWIREESAVRVSTFISCFPFQTIISQWGLYNRRTQQQDLLLAVPQQDCLRLIEPEPQCGPELQVRNVTRCILI